MHPASILIGLDDTDMPGWGGTGRLARELASRMPHELRLAALGVSRHRLLQDPRVPCTRKNQASCIELEPTDEPIELLVNWLRDAVQHAAVPGSDPGICVAIRRQLGGDAIGFGPRAKLTLLSQSDASAVAADAGIVLESLGGSGDGVIGALAAVALRASGGDGRFTVLGRIRELAGVLPVSALVTSAGIAEVRDTSGAMLSLDSRVDTGGKVRPWLRDGKAVLVVEPGAGGIWQPVRGVPD